MTGPGDEMAAAGRGQMRASDADREQVIAMLKVAFVQGRLTKDELDLRVGAAFTARTYAELAVVTADIPAEPTAAQPPPKPAGAGWPPMNSSAKTAVAVIIAATTVTVAVWLIAWFAGNGALLAGAVLATGIDLVILCAAGATLLELRQQKRSGGALPPSATRSAKAARIAGHDRRPGQDALCAVRLAPNARPA